MIRSFVYMTDWLSAVVIAVIEFSSWCSVDVDVDDVTVHVAAVL